jgi:hypothetical protein
MEFWLIFGVVVAIGFVCIRNKELFYLYLFGIITVGGISVIKNVLELISTASRMSIF